METQHKGKVINNPSDAHSPKVVSEEFQHRFDVSFKGGGNNVVRPPPVFSVEVLEYSGEGAEGFCIVGDRILEICDVAQEGNKLGQNQRFRGRLVAESASEFVFDA